MTPGDGVTVSLFFSEKTIYDKKQKQNRTGIADMSDPDGSLERGFGSDTHPFLNFIFIYGVGVVLDIISAKRSL